MKTCLRLSLFVAVLSSASAFAPSQSTTFVSRSSSSALYAEQSRHDFLQAVATAAMSGVLLTSVPRPASAAKYGSFGAGSPEVLDPAEAEVDQDVLKSEPVQNALNRVKGYQETVRKMQASLQADPQTNVKKTIASELDFSKLRETLNTVNTAFEEDTQRGTDRLIRVIMQDITELEQANTQKEGVPRSERRLETMQKKLVKLDKAFGDYLAFPK